MGRRDNLVIDVGMHTGEDTARCLKRGFDVVGIEANPDIVAAASKTFAQEIRSGQLTIVESAISSDRGTARFAVSDEVTVWSSMSPEFIARNERSGTTYRYIDVETIPFQDVLDRFGVPHYLKIDIEGLDMLCVRALRDYEDRPAFVSIETHASTTTASAAATFDELAELWTLGYRKFRYVGQKQADPPPPYVSGVAWRSATQAMALAQVLRLQQNFAGNGGLWSTTIPARAYKQVRRMLHTGTPWYDLQAALG
jgi:FkbM family methyltransferase